MPEMGVPEKARRSALLRRVASISARHYGVELR